MRSLRFIRTLLVRISRVAVPAPPKRPIWSSGALIPNRDLS